MWKGPACSTCPVKPNCFARGDILQLVHTSKKAWVINKVTECSFSKRILIKDFVRSTMIYLAMLSIESDFTTKINTTDVVDDITKLKAWKGHIKIT